MRLHCIQHVPFETPGMIAEWARDKGHRISESRMFAGEDIPGADGYDWLVVMGGPMGAGDESKYGWLAREKRAIAEAIERGKTVLGVCLGAQLIAAVLGARVRRAGQSEIGWYPVYLTPEGRDHPLTANLPDPFPAFHWHGDTFDVPAGALHLARSEACERQIFVYDRRVVGIQCHLESTTSGIAALIEHCRDDLAPGPFVQSPPRMLAAKSRLHDSHATLNSLLDRLPAPPHPGGIR